MKTNTAEKYAFPLLRDLMVAFVAYGTVVLGSSLFNANRGTFWGAVTLFTMLLPVFVLPKRMLARLFAPSLRWTAIASFLAVAALVAVHLAVEGLVRFYLKSMFVVPLIFPLLKNLPMLLLLAFAEEVFFRGYLQETLFGRLWGGKGVGVVTFKNLAAASLFALVHILSYSSYLKVYTLFSGLLFGWLVEKAEGSLWPSVVLHASLNLSASWWSALVKANVVILSLG